MRKDKAEVWAPLKSPIWFKERVAAELGLPLNKVTVHVTQGGGSFGRRLFCDAPFEAVAVSKAMGKPVRLMWHRADMPRQGRAHPMAISRVRLTHTKDQVLACEQRHTSVQTDFTQGLGEVLTASASTPPLQNYLQYSQTVFNLTANVPYDFGVVNQLLNEVYDYNTFNTSSVRNIYSPEVRTAVELMTDKVAKDMGKDPFAFRQEFARFDRLKAVLARLKKESQWGRKLGPGRAQGVAVHNEYHGFVGCVVEIDTRKKTVNRKIAGAVTGPRVTRVTFVVDVGLPINPLGPQGPDDGRDHRRDRPGADLRPAPRGRRLPGGQLGQRLLLAALERASARGRDRDAAHGRSARRRRRVRRGRVDGRHRVRPGARHGQDAEGVPGQPAQARLQAVPRRAPDTRVPDQRAALPQRAQAALGGGDPVPTHSFKLNGERVKVDCPDNVRVLWVLRDLLGVTGPKYGCGINVCKACTCHINGKAFNPCSVPVSKIDRSDEITTIEGLADTVKGDGLHPMQEAWLDVDVAQCGYCQPGQIMTAVSKVNEIRRKEGRKTITDSDIDQIRNVCRCGTYPRIREAIKKGAARMS